MLLLLLLNAREFGFEVIKFSQFNQARVLRWENRVITFLAVLRSWNFGLNSVRVLIFSLYCHLNYKVNSNDKYLAFRTRVNIKLEVQQ